MTDGNSQAIAKYLDERDEWDALQEVTAELEQAESDMLAGLARIEELEAELAKAREEGFWAGRSCGGAKKEIDAALAELKGQDDE